MISFIITAVKKLFKVMHAACDAEIILVLLQAQ
jgi:hypothetical protein